MLYYNKKKRSAVSTGFEPRIFPFTVRCLDHTTRDAVKHQTVIFGQYKILKLLLENSGLKKLKSLNGKYLISRNVNI
jgi:hypothetical protein